MKNIVLFTNDDQLKIFVGRQIEILYPEAKQYYFKTLSEAEFDYLVNAVIFIDYALLTVIADEAAMIIEFAVKKGSPLVLIESNPSHISPELGQIASIVTYAGMRPFVTHLATVLEMAHYIIETNTRNVEGELAYEKYLIQSLMDNIPDSIYFKDIESRYTRINQAHATLLGSETPEFVLGKSNIEFLPIDLAIAGLRDEQQIIKTGLPIVSKIEKLEREDHTIWLSTTKVATKNERGEINGIVGVSRDITQLKLIQDGYKRAMEKAEQSDKLKTAFLANMSHEIRTPMNAIVGFSNLLKNEVSAEKRHEFVQHINESCQNLLHLITDIIEMAKIQAGEEIISNEYFDFNETITNLHEMILEDQGKQNVEIFLNIPNNRQALVIFSDLHKISFIFNSLLRNALKFTENGFIEIGYNYKDSTTLECYVKDTGIGIEEEKLELIFNSFNKLTDRKTKLYGGTGLGLAITRHFVKMLGGEINVKTKLGVGSTFYFTLPIKIAEEFQNDSSLINAPIPLADDVVYERFVILIAEDEELNFILLQEALSVFKNTEILWAKNGEEAVCLSKERNDIQLILMDLKMPNMDGIEATQQIRKFRRNVNIWAETAYSAPSDRKLLLDAGCDDYILKPINPGTIQQKIQMKFKRTILQRK